MSRATAFIITLVSLALVACSKDEASSPGPGPKKAGKLCGKGWLQLTWQPPQLLNEMPSLRPINTYRLYWANQAFAENESYAGHVSGLDVTSDSVVVEGLDSAKTYYFLLKAEMANGETKTLALNESVEGEYVYSPLNDCVTESPVQPKFQSDPVELHDMSCPRTVPVKFMWEPYAFASSYEVVLSLRSGFVFERFKVSGYSQQVDGEVSRGSVINVNLAALRLTDKIKDAEPETFSAMTCDQLAKKKQKDPNFVESYVVRLKWKDHK